MVDRVELSKISRNLWFTMEQYERGRLTSFNAPVWLRRIGIFKIGKPISTVKEREREREREKAGAIWLRIIMITGGTLAAGNGAARW